jgi:ABC-type transporter Mla maintaining outer membrane lipid asymmetry ATPase subunit MlaF
MRAPADRGPEAGQPVVELIDAAVVSLHTPDLVVVDQVQWTVRQRECWVIGGLPASGKSDLLSTAAGLMRPARGNVRLFGEELVHLHEEQRLAVQLRIGVVFGFGGRLFNHLTVAENLALPLHYHRNWAPSDSDPRVHAVLEAMGLAEVAHVTPVLLNRNVRQRVALARGLVLGPELLFLDNPLADVDPRETRWWIEFLGTLVEGHDILEGRPLTLIAGTDDLEPWGELGRLFAFIQNGRFVPMGSRAELLAQPNPALRELLPLAWLRE